MKLSDFDYNLPETLIAHYPSEVRTQSRLLEVLPTGNLHHHQFYQLLDLLDEKDLLVFNNTKVIPARLFAKRPTGGKVEILIERLMGVGQVLAHVRSNKSLKVDAELVLDDGTILFIHSKVDGLFILKARHEAINLLNIIESLGHMPLPPYIKRDDEGLDHTRYQTVYAKQKGAVAAPTAGLHFDQALLDKIAAKGVAQAEVTLHVGAGTFQPVRVENIQEHRMHKEFVEVSEATCAAVAACKARGGRVVSVGTTTLRSLEAASLNGAIAPFYGDTDIFIYPGFEFHCVDALITNFHLPKSSLLMLVSAFSGVDIIRHAYQAAIEARYRFFSYGDAMFLLRQKKDWKNGA